MTSLLACYEALPAFDDVKDSLDDLQKKYQLVAFSNGEKEVIENLLNKAHIERYFSDIISADEIKTFKPNPSIYHHLLNRTNSVANQCWLVSSNPFDVIGAKSIDMNAVWVRRKPTLVYDPWGIEPDMVITQLGDLATLI